MLKKKSKQNTQLYSSTSSNKTAGKFDTIKDFDDIKNESFS